MMNSLRTTQIAKLKQNKLPKKLYFQPKQKWSCGLYQ